MFLSDGGKLKNINSHICYWIDELNKSREILLLVLDFHCPSGHRHQRASEATKKLNSMYCTSICRTLCNALSSVRGPGSVYCYFPFKCMFVWIAFCICIQCTAMQFNNHLLYLYHDQHIADSITFTRLTGWYFIQSTQRCRLCIWILTKPRCSFGVDFCARLNNHFLLIIKGNQTLSSKSKSYL